MFSQAELVTDPVGRQECFPKLNSVKDVSLTIINTCFFRCKMCSFWKNEDKAVLGLDVFRRFIRDLGNISSEKTMVTFTGGETLSHPDIFEMISEASAQGFRTNLNTNGWLLSDTVTEHLLDSGVHEISLSLDGSSPELHDMIRGMPGSYEKLVSAVRKIKRKSSGHKRPAVNINTVISALNLRDIKNLVEFVEKNEYLDSIRFQAVSFPLNEATDTGCDDQDKSGTHLWYKGGRFGFLWPRREDRLLLREVYTYLIRNRTRGGKVTDTKDKLVQQYLYFLHPGLRKKNRACTIFEDLQINVDGNVFHCAVRNQAIGNINTESIADIWNSRAALESRKSIVDCRINCHQLINCSVSKREFKKEFDVGYING